MSGIPVRNLDILLEHLRTRTNEITNEEIIQMAGGTNAEWGSYMAGHRANDIIQFVNSYLAAEDAQLVNEGRGRWLAVTVSESHMRRAHFNLSRIDRAYQRAYKAVLQVSRDIRHPKLQTQAEAWLTLFDEPQSEGALSILRVWAGELTEHIAKLLPPKVEP